jgi:hypothetical protein
MIMTVPTNPLFPTLPSPLFSPFEEMSNVDFSQIEPRLTVGTLDALKGMGFSKMTPVQAATIPLFLTNKVRADRVNRMNGGDIERIEGVFSAVLQHIR